MVDIRKYDANCPIDDALELISRKWVIFLIRDMYLENTHFSDFKSLRPELSNMVLNDTLKFMEEKNLIFKSVDSGNKKSTEYYLTHKGKNLNKIIYAMLVYGLEEVNSAGLNDEQKLELINEYKKLLSLNH